MGLQEPEYRVIYNWIVDSISNGSLKLGARLPSKDELSQRFQLNRQTIRHAIDLLEQQKLVIRVRGNGIYVGGEDRLGRQGRYVNVTVISTYTDSYVSPTILREIESVLSQKGYTTRVAFTGNRTGREQETLSNLIDRDMIDDLIVEPVRNTLPNPNLRCYRELMNRRIPVLFFNCTYPELGLPFVATNNVSASGEAMGYLIRAGHRKIGGIFRCNDGQGPLRYRGFIQEMEETGLRARNKNVVWIGSKDMVKMEYWSDYLLHHIGDCTAVVCYSDEVTYILSGICKKREISIPDQLSLVGIDDSGPSTLAEVPATSLPYPMKELRWEAAENIVRIIENPRFDGSYHFGPDAIGRDSVKLIKDDDAKQ